MQTQSMVVKTASRLPGVRLDETLMTIMLVNEQPIIAVTANLFNDEAALAEGGSRHIVRVDDEWVEAKRMADVARARFSSNPPTRRRFGGVGEPPEVVSTIAWLIAPERSWVTGQVFGVDDGLSTLRRRVKV